MAEAKCTFTPTSQHAAVDKGSADIFGIITFDGGTYATLNGIALYDPKGNAISLKKYMKVIDHIDIAPKDGYVFQVEYIDETKNYYETKYDAPMYVRAYNGSTQYTNGAAIALSTTIHIMGSI